MVTHHSTIMPVSTEHILLACLKLSIIVVFLSRVCARESCVAATNRCTSRVGCSVALQNLNIVCTDLLMGKSSTCTLQCKQALISLLTTEDHVGDEFINCDCGPDDSYCLTKKEHMLICNQDVIEAMDSIYDNSTIACSLAGWICEADASCYKALDYYQLNCQELHTGSRCSNECNNSLSILFRQQKARKLVTCECDGNEPYDCPKVKYYTRKLCLLQDHSTPSNGKYKPIKLSNNGPNRQLNIILLISVCCMSLMNILSSYHHKRLL